MSIKETRLSTGFWVGLAFFGLAVWSVSPFFRIDAKDYAQAERNIIRLFFGLFILLTELGILAFETFSPQGFARKVSNIRAVAVFLLGLLILALVIFIVAQSVVVYLRTGLSELDSIY